jgi:hypothetical protein
MAIKRVNIGKTNFIFVFRHRFEKPHEDRLLDSFTIWREWELGFFFRRFQVVGKRNFNKPNEWKKNLVYEYMFGINLLWCKAWFTIERGAMVMDIDMETKIDE